MLRPGGEGWALVSPDHEASVAMRMVRKVVLGCVSVRMPAAYPTGRLYHRSVHHPTQEEFARLIARERAVDPGATLAVPIVARTLADQLTPVLAYRRLVASDPRNAPSFLLESVEGGERQGRYSLLGADPICVIVSGQDGTTEIASDGTEKSLGDRGGLEVVRERSRAMRLVHPDEAMGVQLPGCFLGGWVGYAAYDTARTIEPEKLGVHPPDDRGLPDVALALHDGVIVFDHVQKVVYFVRLALVAPTDEPAAAYERAQSGIDAWVRQIETHAKPLPVGLIESSPPSGETRSNTTRDQFYGMVDRALEYIKAGDIFQVVLGQRFERQSQADPFDVYRSLRAVNPSPYMVYMQSPGCILVAASPEILCRVRRTRDGGMLVTNRPLAGTRRRGADAEEDRRLEEDLLADQKERAEHVMLVDLARNDVGRVARPGSVECGTLMAVERYSHVMHISSTVTGQLREGLDAWDALLAALPVGTVSGAPKIRAMQVIDELEPVKRGPYGGGFGYVGLDGEMDMALALRTMVVPTTGQTDLDEPGRVWTYHLQAAAGVVADSRPESEFEETINKAMGMARAIDLAESAFGRA